MKLNKLVSTLNMEHSTWLKYRRKGVGGSDAGSICGLNPYSTAIAVFQDKVQQLYQADKSTQQVIAQGGVLQSYSNDGESGTFDLSQSTFTEGGKAKKIREIIHRHLGNTGLLYRGV